MRHVATFAKTASANASAPLRGTNFGKISGVETEKTFCAHCLSCVRFLPFLFHFDVIVCDSAAFSRIFDSLSPKKHASHRARSLLYRRGAEARRRPVRGGAMFLQLHGPSFDP